MKSPWQSDMPDFASQRRAGERKQKPGKIMKHSAFKEIERKAREAGYDDPKAVAGAAYWRTVKAKHKKAKEKSGKE
jgi:hypothetical protein